MNGRHPLILRTCTRNLNFKPRVALQGAGNLEAASQQLEALLRAHPSAERVATQLALLRLQQDRPAEAAALCQNVLAADPANAAAHMWCGEAKRRLGQLEASVDALSAALRLRPDLAPAWFNIALALRDLERFEEARNAWVAFLGLRPGDARVRTELGKLAMEAKEFAEAERWFREQCSEFPQQHDARCDLAAALLAREQFESARQTILPLLKESTRHPRAWMLLARSLLNEHRTEEAAVVLRQAVTAVAGSADLHALLGTAEDRLANLPSAIAAFGQALRLSPSANVWNALGVAYMNLASHDRSIQAFRNAMALDPAFAAAHSNLLMTLHYQTNITPDQIFQEHLGYARQHAGTPKPSTLSRAMPPARIRIGYLSPRFGEGPIAHFVLPLLRHHDHSKFEIFCYSTSDHEDAATVEMKACADAWRACASMSDDSLAGAIQSDAIDIMVDLVGHCPGNRLQMLSRRVAPVQVTWMDYVDTTGLEAIDYILTDEGHTPTITPQRYSEKVVRLRDVRLCYEPTRPLPAIAPPPCLRRGFATFGCFNRLSKFGPLVLDTWADIMRRLPTSRLLLKATAFASSETRADVRHRFAMRGIADDRIELRPFSDERTMLEEYADVDLALDPFPYNGCTTTCDALVMGVPVVSLAGSTLAGRHGASILGAVGLDMFLAPSLDAYKSRAIALAEARDQLVGFRGSLRDLMLASPMCDARAFASSVEDAFTAMVEAGLERR